jgi:adenylate cyclase
MAETRKLAAILAADVVGYTRLAGSDEERTLARLRGLRSDLIDPTIAVHHGRVVKRTGDGIIIEFRSVVDAVRCAIEVQNGMVERNAGLPPERRIDFRVGIHLGDVVEESDGDLMGNGVNIAARLESLADTGGICLSEDAYRQVRDRIEDAFIDLGEKALKNIARPVRAYAIKMGSTGTTPAPQVSAPEKPSAPDLSVVVLPFANLGGDPEQEYFVDGVTESLTTDLSRISGSFVIGRSTAFTYKGKHVDLKQIGRELNVARDAGNINALVAAGWVDFYRATLFANNRAALLAAAEATMAKALSLAPDHAFAHACLGNVMMNTNRATDGIAECERALVLDRNLTGAHAAIGNAKYFIGRAEETEAHIREALRLSPRDTGAHVWMAVASVAKLVLCRDEEAIAWLRRAIEANRNYPMAHLWLAVGLAHLGRLTEARAAAQAALALHPSFTIARFRAGASSDNPIYLAQRERLFDGMRKAGVPEG